MSGSATSKSLRDYQLEAVISMLNLNSKNVSSGLSGAATDLVWKVLIYDHFGQQTIAPLLRIADLRENNITVHSLLHSTRQSIPDVPAVYFIAPTQENVLKICEDLSSGLYESYYINFSSAVPRDLLETLAHNTLQSDSYSRVAQVYDQYLNYLCLERNMFSLGLKDSYFELHNPKASDTQIEALVSQIVSALFSIFITTGQIPVIRAPKGNAAEMVASGLESRLRDYVRSERIEPNKDSLLASSQRPVLIILDRNSDLSTMLRHTWSYQCLAHDVLDMNANRITVLKDENGNSSKKVYDIAMKDFFWSKNATAPFPQMAEDVDAELRKYKLEVDEITKSCGVDSLDQISASDPNTSARSLKAAISSLPALTDRKRTIDMHMNIAHALLEIIKNRHLDKFISMEDSIAKQSITAIMEVLKSPDYAAEDKARLFLVYYLSVSPNTISKSELKEMETSLSEAGVDLSCFTYLKSVRAFSNMANMVQPSFNITSQESNNDLFGRFSSKLTGIRDSGILGSAVDSLYAGVSSIIPTKQNLPVVRTVGSILTGQGKDDEDFATFDPKSKIRSRPATAKAQYQDAYVFVVGGGNYVEYQNLLEYQMSTGKNITYGSTQILNAKEFMEQLNKLG